MKKLHYTITTLEPLIITQHSDDPNMYETLQYIRGTVIQGVFAQNYIKANNGIADDQFTRLIVSGDCIFENAFPTANDNLYIPSPLALVREKYNPKVAHNLLTASTVEQTKGISSLVFVDGTEINPLTIRKEIRLHNEIDDDKRTSKDGILFNYQSLPAGIVFKGAIAVRNDDDEAELKKIIPVETNLRIGRSATSEYGNVCFKWVEASTAYLSKDSGQVIMTLLSDAIIYNESGFSSLLINDLGNYLKGVSITNSISRKSRIEGFLNVWKLRKPSENVFVAGSSFLLDKLPDNATELTSLGLGERTHEGYGQVSFTMLDPVIDKLKYNEWKETTFTKPVVIPELAYKIWGTACLKRKKEEVVKNALQDADDTEGKIPTNHLLGKLKGWTGDTNSFTQNLDELKDIAKGQLNKAFVGKKTMFDHLKERADHIEKICDLTYLYEDVVFDLSGSKHELTRIYLEQYLKQLRRKTKTTER